MLSVFELTGLIFGTFGGMILVVPELFEKYLFCCCFKKAQPSQAKTEKAKDEAVNIEDLVSLTSSARVN